MKVTAYLFINSSGSLRITKKDSAAYPSELGVHLVVDVPDIFFRRPMPRVDVQVPAEFLINPNSEIVASMVATPPAEALKLDVTLVEDGLLTMLKNGLIRENK